MVHYLLQKKSQLELMLVETFLTNPDTLLMSKYYENWKVRKKHVLLSPKCILLHEKQIQARDAKMCMQSATFILEKTE